MVEERRRKGANLEILAQVNYRCDVDNGADCFSDIQVYDLII